MPSRTVSGSEEKERRLASILKASLQEWRLTLMKVRKPSRDEYMQALKITLLGITIVGLAAYLIHLAAVTLLGG